jgi:hypothetical protein
MWRTVAAPASSPACASMTAPGPFLCTSIPAILSAIETSRREAAGSVREEIKQRHVLPTFPAGWLARHRLLQTRIPDQTRKRRQLIQSSPGLRRSTPIR